MIPTPPETQLRRKVTHRLVASRYPSIGILDRVSDAADLDAVFELEGWTNDRITSELGILHRLPPDEWLVGRADGVSRDGGLLPPAGWRRAVQRRDAGRVVCVVHAGNGARRGRVPPRTRAGGGGRDGRAHGDAAVRCRGERRVPRYPDGAARVPALLYDPDTYATSQRFALDLLAHGSNGVVYRSVRRDGGTCLACFRPRLLARVRVGAHFETDGTATALLPSAA